MPIAFSDGTVYEDEVSFLADRPITNDESEPKKASTDNASKPNFEDINDILDYVDGKGKYGYDDTSGFDRYKDWRRSSNVEDRRNDPDVDDEIGNLIMRIENIRKMTKELKGQTKKGE